MNHNRKKERLVPLSGSSIDRLARMIRRGINEREIAAHEFKGRDGRYRKYPRNILNDVIAQEVRQA